MYLFFFVYIQGGAKPTRFGDLIRDLILNKKFLININPKMHP